MERSTCACCNELKPPSRTRTVSIEDGGSWLARIRTRLTWEHTTFACSAEVIDSTKRLYSSEAPLLAGIPLAPSGVAIDEQGSVEVRGRTIRSKALNAIDLLSHLLVPFRLHCALFATKVCVGGGLTRMRLPRLCPCAATSPPSHFLRVGTHHPQPQPTVHLSKYSCSSLSLSPASFPLS